MLETSAFEVQPHVDRIASRLFPLIHRLHIHDTSLHSPPRPKHDPDLVNGKATLSLVYATSFRYSETIMMANCGCKEKLFMLLMSNANLVSSDFSGFDFPVFLWPVLGAYVYFSLRFLVSCLTEVKTFVVVCCSSASSFDMLCLLFAKDVKSC